jgi:tRNA(Glu) U13 pseudouridine synthase TruD
MLNKKDEKNKDRYEIKNIWEKDRPNYIKFILLKKNRDTNQAINDISFALK